MVQRLSVPNINHLLANADIPPLTGPGVIPGANGTIALEKIVGQIFGVLTIFAVIYFIIQVILAGYSFISAQGDTKAIESARKRLTDGILGLTIVVIAVGLGSLIASLAGIPNVLDLNGMLDLMNLPQP